MDFQVTFIPEDNLLYQEKYAKLLQKIGVEVLYRPFITSVEQHLKESGGRYDLAFLFRQKVVERNIENVKKYCPQAKTLYYTHDLHHLRMMREAELVNDESKKSDAEEMKLKELKAISVVDSTILVSSAELELLRFSVPDRQLEVLPLVYGVSGTEIGYENRKDLVFLGGGHHPPNRDAVKYFCMEVMPLLLNELPEIKLHVIGDNHSEDVLSLASGRVIIHGFVDDLNGLLDQMKIAIAPMRFGAGMKGKVCSTLGAGLPNVLSSIAAEGLGIVNMKNSLIADTADEMVSAILNLYGNEQLWNTISSSGIKHIDKLNGAHSSYQKLKAILHSLSIKIHESPKSISLYKDSWIN
jgi:hypothetical protein